MARLILKMSPKRETDPAAPQVFLFSFNSPAKSNELTTCFVDFLRRLRNDPAGGPAASRGSAKHGRAAAKWIGCPSAAKKGTHNAPVPELRRGEFRWFLCGGGRGGGGEEGRTHISWIAAEAGGWQSQQLAMVRERQTAEAHSKLHSQFLDW